jgi:ATP-dependent RNA helicase DDX27
MADLLPSLSSDDENDSGNQHDEDDEEDVVIDESFQFGGILGEDGVATTGTYPSGRGRTEWSFQTALDSLQTANAIAHPRMDIDALISAKRRSLQQSSTKQNAQGDHNEEENKDESDSGTGSDQDEDVDDSHRHLEADVLTNRSGAEKDDPGDDAAEHERNEYPNEDGEEDSDCEEAAKADAFFDNDASLNRTNKQQTIEEFSQLSLSRPLLRGVAAMGFVQPTPIQAAIIPLALQGRDICASAVTGSGKTAAFLLPISERLLHRQYGGTTKGLILTPTRELAAQCLGMFTTLCTFTSLRAALIVGGTKNGASQAAELRRRPDIIVATPGRLLDHVTNTTGVSLDDIEYLVLDEADRLLDLGFFDECMEIVKACPAKRRQTLLFSATLNTKVDDLIQLSLQNPVRVRISDNDRERLARHGSKSLEVAPRLEQEFVRIRAGNEGTHREAMLLALLTRTYTDRVICFFDTKAAAHRLMILAGLCGIKCAELHGNLTQPQRLSALESFRSGEVHVLLATDLAARGLDIDSVQTVLNFEMPSQIETYIHRIGRTARAGRSGRSCTLIGEGRRHLMKELIKDNAMKTASSAEATAKGIIRSRSIPTAVVAHFAAKIQTLEQHVEEVMEAEVVAKMDRLAEMEVTKAQNLIEHADEIAHRPAKEWFATPADKRNTKQALVDKMKLIAEKAGTGVHRMTRKKRRAREVAEAMADGDDDYNEGGGSDSNEPKKKSSKKLTPLQIKSEVRKEKRQLIEKKHELANKSIRDLDSEQAAKLKKKRKSSSSAAGDGSLFDDEKVSYAGKQNIQKGAKLPEATVAKSSYKFVGHDPDKKLGKKKAHKAFKSKSKHKRR